jgi:hypothetical protein
MADYWLLVFLFFMGAISALMGCYFLHAENIFMAVSMFICFGISAWNFFCMLISD